MQGGSRARGRRHLLSKESVSARSCWGKKVPREKGKEGRKKKKSFVAGRNCLLQHSRHASFQFCFLYHIHQKKNTTRFKKWLSKPKAFKLPIPTCNIKFRCFQSFYPLLVPRICSHEFAWCKPASLHRSISTSTKLLSLRPGKPLHAATRPHCNALVQHMGCQWTP